MKNLESLHLPGDAAKLAANLNNDIASLSFRVRRIIEKFKFGEEIEKLDEADRLYQFVKEITVWAN